MKLELGTVPGAGRKGKKWKEEAMCYDNHSWYDEEEDVAFRE